MNILSRIVASFGIDKPPTPKLFNDYHACKHRHSIGHRHNQLIKKPRQNSDKCSDVDGNIDKIGKQPCIFLREMLAGKNHHRFVKHQHVIYAAFFGAFALVMNYSGFGKIVILISCLNNPVRQIDIFAIHKKRLIQ